MGRIILRAGNVDTTAAVESELKQATRAVEQSELMAPVNTVNSTQSNNDGTNQFSKGGEFLEAVFELMGRLRAFKKVIDAVSQVSMRAATTCPSLIYSRYIPSSSSLGLRLPLCTGKVSSYGIRAPRETEEQFFRWLNGRLKLIKGLYTSSLLSMTPLRPFARWTLFAPNLPACRNLFPAS